MTRTVLLGMLCLSLVALGCSSPETSTEVADATASAATPHVETVETTRASYGTLDALLIASGTVIAPRTTLLSAEVSGRIAEVHVDEGDVLRQGDVAFVVEPEPYQIDREEARAGLQLAEAQAAQEEQELERTRSLAEQQIVADQELDFRRTQVAVAEARVAQARANLSRAERDLERTVVRAPYDSTVVERHLHEGANLAGPASVVLTIQALDGFEAQLAIPEASAVQARTGDPVTLIIQGRAQPVDSVVASVNSRIDPESRTYSVRTPVPSGLGAKAGAFVRAEVKPRSDRVALVVPRTSVLRRDGRNIVFRYEDDRAEQVEVQLGATGLDRVEIVAGLSEGDEVIFGKLVDRLADGTPVSRGETSAPPPTPEAPTPSSTDESSVAPAEPVALLGVESESTPGETLVHVLASSPIGLDRTILETVEGGSPRTLLRLRGVRAEQPEQHDIGSPELRRIRTGLHPELDELHVVLDLTERDLEIETSHSGQGLTVRVARPKIAEVAP